MHVACYIQELALAVFFVCRAFLLHKLATLKILGFLEPKLPSLACAALHMLFPPARTLSFPSLCTANLHFRTELSYYYVTPLLTPLGYTVYFIYVFTEHPDFCYQVPATLY